MLACLHKTQVLGLRSAFGKIHSSRSLAQPRFASRLRSTVATYNHLEVEQKWQKYWDEHATFATRRRPGHKKKYVLDMFPYPSGAGLHVGHPEGYTATDIMARYWRMLDFDVLHPMGWDAFGLPAEQHAINTGTHPAVTTYENIATFKRQLKSLGFSYDWARELATTEDNYVKWTQWIFLQLFKNGLASQSGVSVNWCPALGTVLANEEIINGLSERGNHPVVRQPLRQWVLKITQYADQLEEGLEGLQWPDGTMTAQKQWIGKSIGAEIDFLAESGQSIKVFTTRPDTLMGVTYLVIAPENPLVDELTTDAQREEVRAYKQRIAGKSDLERTSVGKERGKTGVALGSMARHPLTGAMVPVWTADYVLAGYGTGSVMAVPAHDERDFEFATLFDLEIKQVVANPKEEVELPYTQMGVVVNSGADLDGISSGDAQAVVISKLEQLQMGRTQITYKLRDWVFSRQRYWGEPIPIYFPVKMLTADGSGNPALGDAHSIDFDTPIPVPESELPLKLPEMDNFQPGDDPMGCLARAKDWRFFQRDGEWFARETNTMPQWAGSCWYYLRFTDPGNEKSIMSPEAASWLPVDLYVGGQEHAVLHLLYARFWHKVLFDIGVVDHPEPFVKLVHQGMILGGDGEKMSKSRGNVINPDDIVNEFGADALRLYEMFMGPLEAVKPWQTNQITGVVRFRDRVFNLVRSPMTNKGAQGDMLKDMHKTIKKVTGDVDRLAFNTAISNLMIFSNSLAAMKDEPLPREAVEALVLLLSPFAPHVAEECWQMLGHKKSLAYAAWPTYDEELCVDSVVTVAIQVNGKFRGKLDVAPDTSEEKVLAAALEQPSVAKFTEEKEIKKLIFVPGKILNIVV
ncbi:leucine--tRNA ligase [Ochromonadaceae sp. CCMP2298]|nr:leucine--tRNA ligase [Ochromonadaceae sp. CCMP2298]